MDQQDLVLNLKAAGFGEDQTREYLAAWNEENIPEQLRLLSVKRKSLLEQIHQEEKQIGCLDYLVYQIEQDTVRA